MGFRVRRSIKLGPLARVNLSKSGASLSLGVRGATVNLGSRGARVSAGIPGTGLSYSTNLTGGSQASHASAPSGSSPGCGCALGILLLVVVGLGVVIATLQKAGVSDVASVFLAIGIFVAATIVWHAHKDKRRKDAAAAEKAAHERNQQERWNYLCTKFGEDVAKRVWDGRVWLGCPRDALIEMLGPPSGVDEKVMKESVRHTFKYRPIGTNRFGLRVMLEDGVVVGWEEKDT